VILFFSFSIIFNFIFNFRISSNFETNIFMNGSDCFSILNVIVLSSVSNSNCFRNKKSWRALIFSFWSVILLFILYVYVTGLPASGLLKSTRVLPLSLERIFTSWPSRFSCMPRCGSIFCSWKCFVGIIRTSCGFRLPNASSGFSSRVYFLLSSAFSASAFMFVSKISFVFEIFPVNSISMKSFLVTFVIGVFCEEGL